MNDWQWRFKQWLDDTLNGPADFLFGDIPDAFNGLRDRIDRSLSDWEHTLQEIPSLRRFREEAEERRSKRTSQPLFGEAFGELFAILRGFQPALITGFIAALPLLAAKAALEGLWLLGSLPFRACDFAAALWRQTNWIVRLLAVAASIVLIAAAFHARQAWRWTKEQRAQRLMSEVETLQSEGRDADAYRRARTAFLLSPDNVDTLHQLRELSQSVNPRETSFWSRQIRQLGALDDATRLELLQDAVDASDTREARWLLDGLEAETANESLLDAQIRLELEDGHIAKAVELARNARQLGEASPASIRLLAAALQLENNPAQDAEFLQWLSELSEGESRTSLASLSLLVARFDRPADALRADSLRLLNHPLAERGIRLNTWVLRLDQGWDSWDSVRSDVFAQFDLQTADERDALCLWLLNNKLFPEVITLAETHPLTRETSRSALLSRILLGENVSSELDAESTSRNRLLLVDRRLLQAVNALRFESHEDFLYRVERILDAAPDEELAYVERELARLGHTEALIRFYSALRNRGGFTDHAVNNLRSLHYNSGNQEALFELLASTPSPVLPEQKTAFALAAYLYLLAGVHIDAVLEQLERRLTLRQPDLQGLLTTQFAYQRLGRPDLAAGINANLNASMAPLPPFLDFLARTAGINRPGDLAVDQLPLAIEKSLAQAMSQASR